MALLRTAQLAAAPGVHFISIGQGWSGADFGKCREFRRGGKNYPVLIDSARELKGKVTFGGIFTMLGGTDKDPASLPAFGPCMQGIAADMRADLEDPNIPYMIGGYEMNARGEYSPTLPEVKQIIAALTMLPAQVTRSALIPAEMNQLKDDHHFTLRGHRTWAEAAIALTKEKGFAPWATR
jgi:hypothetical protein